MDLSRTVLMVSSGVLLAVGVLFLLAPDFMATQINLPLASNLASAEIRSMYGGVEIGLGLFLLVSTFSTPMVRPAVLALTFYVSGLIFGRVMGITFDDAKAPKTLLLLFIELGWLCFALNAWLFDRGEAMVAPKLRDLKLRNR